MAARRCPGLTATLAPPQVKPFALGGAVVYGASIGAMRSVFGHHFLSDVIFAGLITIAIVMGFYVLLMDPIRRKDARVEKWIERSAVALHRNVGALLSNAGTLMAGQAAPCGRPDRTCTSAPPAYSRGRFQPSSCPRAAVRGRFP